MVGHDRDRVGVEKDLETVDEPAGHVEALGDGLQVVQQQRAIHSGIIDQIVDRMRLAVRQSGHEVEDSSELFGGCHGGQAARRTDERTAEWCARVSRTRPRYSSTNE